MSDDGARQRGHLAVPIRRVFPWWYLVGAVVTAAVLILLDPDGNQAMIAFWGPAIGITIREREQTARARSDQGLPVDGASLRSEPWLEPLSATLLTGAAVGIGLLLDALFGHRTFVTTWVGAGFLVASAVCFLAVLLVLRARRRRRRAAAARPVS
ncbi:hypothetical protein DEJ13_03760 [Curtobacterium sp. MCLR17_007]|uniref:hypothetical protein n=1 Tax=Curtobacterium sp. MCLR17_007 TaxID=2175648 RepID=UPI000DA6FE9F|nr:hypothetical protein [Curtobacterium sp. MCLR17_007]WIB60963.1 hypothetical protein DEJ13_03760 [Curtobacterium sp. MCLR17_007]